MDNRIENLASGILTSRKLLIAIFLSAVIFTVACVNSGIAMDDYHMKRVMLDPDNQQNFMDSPFDIFNFFNGDPEKMQAMIDFGWLPWWFTDTDIKASFWRPLSAFTHWLDYILFDGNPKIMHLHSILWYAALAVSVAICYRRIMGPTVAAGLAGLMWVLDDTHGTPVGFITNRNALIACLFCILALIAHDKWYKQKHSKWLFLALASLAASLLAKEAGIATVAYIFAYVVFLESGTWKNKIARFSPYIIVVIVWRIIWVSLGYGIKNVGIYTDPINEPIRFLIEMPGKMVLLLSGQLANIPSDFSILFGNNVTAIIIFAEVLILAVLAVILRPLLKTDITARFWACGMILSLIPCCAAFASDRMLMFVGIGAMGLTAQLFVFIFRSKDFYKPKRLLKIVSTVVIVLLMFGNIFLAPVGLYVKSLYPFGPPILFDSCLPPPIDDENVVNQNVIYVNPPSAFLASFSPYLMDPVYKNKPDGIRVLCSSMLGPTKVTRIDERSIEVRPTGSFVPTKFERVFNDPTGAYVGKVYRHNNFEVRVTLINEDAAPAAAIFTFDKPLEDPSFRWIRWSYGYYEPYTPPAIGKSEVLYGGTLKGGIKYMLKGAG